MVYLEASKFKHHLYHHIEVDITNVELLKTLIEGIKETEINLLVNNSVVTHC